MELQNARGQNDSAGRVASTRGKIMTITMDLIFEFVSDEFEVPRERIIARGRGTRSAFLSRQCALYIARDMTTMSLSELGEACGGRDHTSVIAALKRHKRNMEKMPIIRTRTALVAAKVKTALNERRRATSQTEESWVSKIVRGETVSEVK